MFHSTLSFRLYGIGRFLALVIRRLSMKEGEPLRLGIDGDRDLCDFADLEDAADFKDSAGLLDLEREDERAEEWLDRRLREDVTELLLDRGLRILLCERSDDLDLDREDTDLWRWETECDFDEERERDLEWLEQREWGLDEYFESELLDRDLLWEWLLHFPIA